MSASRVSNPRPRGLERYPSLNQPEHLHVFALPTAKRINRIKPPTGSTVECRVGILPAVPNKPVAGIRTNVLAISHNRVKPLRQAPAGSLPRAPKRNDYHTLVLVHVYLEQANDLERPFRGDQSSRPAAPG